MQLISSHFFGVGYGGVLWAGKNSGKAPTAFCAGRRTATVEDLVCAISFDDFICAGN
jgi:hypothetical protein